MHIVREVLVVTFLKLLILNLTHNVQTTRRFCTIGECDVQEERPFLERFLMLRTITCAYQIDNSTTIKRKRIVITNRMFR